MKAFFSRFVQKEPSASTREKEKEIGKLPPLKAWPPAPPGAERTESRDSRDIRGRRESQPTTTTPTPTGTPYAVFKPLPEVQNTSIGEEEDDGSASDDTATPTRTPTQTPTPPEEVQSQPQTRGPSRGTPSMNSDVQKKVAFLSPERSLDTVHEINVNGSGANSSPSPSPIPNPSFRSDTPYSQLSSLTNGTSSTGSRILSATSWSEVTEEDLVSNLGSRERTRQEVLFEIISSEERYVSELGKMREMFIEPLLHPYNSSSGGAGRGRGEEEEVPAVGGTDTLPPIAARFMSPTPDPEEGESDEERSMAKSKWDSPRSPYRSGRQSTKKKTIPFPGIPGISGISGTRSHQSLPPPSRNQGAVSTQSLGRERANSQTQTGLVPPIVPPHLLPKDLKVCLEVIDTGVYDGHKRLAEALRKRFDDQYPLVRSLADVFVANSDIFQGYAQYVLHLERALEQVDNAINDTSPPPKKSQSQQSQIPHLFRTLDTLSSYAGQTSLSISLSKPFQRLLKYPLLFQNLLYNTDPSTTEYESTLQLVAEIESMVRGIEDEKVEWEDRERTRDGLARIEWGDGGGSGGGGRLSSVGRPKLGRVLIEERQAPSESLIQNKKSKSSFRRLSDALTPLSPQSTTSSSTSSSSIKPFSKKDLWLVVFNDVVLLCQRTGVTTIPIWSANININKGKDSKPARKQQRVRPRNLYKFVKVQNWVIGDVVQPKEGVVAKADISRSRANLSSQPRIIPMPADDEHLPKPTISEHDSDDDDNSSDDSDRKSKMSFSYWGADKVTVQRPVIASAGRSTSSLSNGKTLVVSSKRGAGGLGVRGRPAGTNSSYRPSQGFYGAGGGAPQGRVVLASRRGHSHSLGPSPLRHGAAQHPAGGSSASVSANAGAGAGASPIPSLTAHTASPSAYSRESSANAKFGTRLVSDIHKEKEKEKEKERPSSRRTGTSSRTRTMTTTSTTADDREETTKSTVTAVSRSVNSSPNISNTTTRSRNTSLKNNPPGPSPRSPSQIGLSKSQGGSAGMMRSPIPVGVSKSQGSTSLGSTPVSPAPSEDSGVGLYRQMLAKEKEKEKERV